MQTKQTLDTIKYCFNADGDLVPRHTVSDYQRKTVSLQINAKISPERQSILKALIDAGEVVNLARLQVATGMRQVSLRKALSRMAADKQIIKPRRGRYQHPIYDVTKSQY